MKYLKILKKFFKRDGSKKRKILTWVDKLTFSHILIIWFLIIISFGLCYFFLAGKDSFLFYTTNQTIIRKITDVIYFSFVTATTTGFGDIIPIGGFKIISIFEVICGLMLLALVTSKLVSIKQDMILGELYESSFSEKINRLRSSLLLFRQNLSRIITRVEDGSIKKREITDLHMYISSFEEALDEILALLGKTSKYGFTKSIDPVDTELIIISILNSFEKINELIVELNGKNIEWRREITLNYINKTLNVNEAIFEKINSSKRLGEKSLSELNAFKKEVISIFKNNLNTETKQEVK